MKIQLHFKTPDTVDMALDDAFGTEIGEPGSDERDKAQDAIEKFVKYGENITIEVDTETQTACVVPCR